MTVIAFQGTATIQDAGALIFPLENGTCGKPEEEKKADHFVECPLEINHSASRGHWPQATAAFPPLSVPAHRPLPESLCVHRG